MKAIVVLGAAVWANGPSPALTRRCEHAAQIWQSGGYDAIVVCGGLGRFPPTEAVVMADVLRASGVPAQTIHLEDQSTTTLENLTLARDILTRLHCADITIVTDTYHRPRAAMVARFLGLRARTSGPAAKGAHPPTQAKQYVREMIALPAYALRLGVKRLRGAL